jgi:hypothetical protein
LACAQAQLREVERARRTLVREGNAERLDKVRRLQSLPGIGVNGAWLLVMEFFGWRQFSNGKEFRGAGGLTGCRGREGFASYATTLPWVLSSVPRWCGRWSSASFPPPVLPSPANDGLGHHELPLRGLHDVRYLRPAGSLPDPRSGLSGGTAPDFRPRSVSSASWFWLLPCRAFHPLGCIDLSGHAGHGHGCTVHGDRTTGQVVGVDVEWRAPGGA